MIDLELLQHAVMDSRDGITIADARADDLPLIFVNPAFERMTGYSHDEVVGRNCRFLQRGRTEAARSEQMRAALAKGQGFSQVITNYRKDDTPFWNELSVSPIHNEHGTVTHFIGFQKDVTQRMLLDEELRARNRDLESAKEALEELVTLDALTGVYNRRHFDDRMESLFKICRRTGESLAVFFIDIDHFKAFNDRFGHQAGDNALIEVAQTLAESFQRGSDFLARYGGEEFVVVACGMEAQPARDFADRLCARVRELGLENPDAPGDGLTISVGYTVVVPHAGLDAQAVVAEADEALFAAKHAGRDQACEATARTRRRASSPRHARRGRSR
ncbi:PAS/PAC sensor-containing diguanylate cyclase [Salinisphaera sp. T5B8]|uniref:diguanylate cyclase n=1 Tax=unclassified Salinisphaera TaxID=2649847 RepID=UPI003341AC76